MDISAGWGDRLLAAIVNNNEYLGFDPNTALNVGHDQMISMFGDANRHKIIYLPFEDVTSEDIGNDYDAVLSSPPFLNVEIYHESPLQSNNKFPHVTSWLKGFLFTSLLKAWNALNPNGYLIIHMGDVKGLQITEPMNLYIEDYLPGSSYEGIIGVSGERTRIC